LRDQPQLIRPARQTFHVKLAKRTPDGVWGG
jgi:hypothetical protein